MRCSSSIQHSVTFQATYSSFYSPFRLMLYLPCCESLNSSQQATRICTDTRLLYQTQTSLRCYGGARKTAYQLDLFIHKYALPTSTALHKRGQEFSAVSKWLKKVLGNDDRILDAGEMATLRKASNALNKWAEGLVAHAEIVSSAAQGIVYEGFELMTACPTDESCRPAHSVHHYRAGFVERIHLPTSRFPSPGSYFCSGDSFSIPSPVSFIYIHRSQLLLPLHRTSPITVAKSGAPAICSGSLSCSDYISVCTISVYILRLRLVIQCTAI
jgi:hypothetical protein